MPPIYEKEPKTDEIELYEKYTIMEKLFKYALIHFEKPWLSFFRLNDQKYDNFQYTFTSKLPVYDLKAYKLNKDHRFVYDKLWVAKSQNMQCGDLQDINIDKIEFPIFIKPKHGHKTATSKHCHKIKKPDELKKFKHLKDMMWSEFIPNTEGMTDFVFYKGNMVHQVTYKYSDKQNGFTDDYKYIDPNTKPPSKISDWVNRYFKSYNGVVNAQYRGDKIIEVGLRLARGGNYLLATNNRDLIVNINQLYNIGQWDYNRKLNFDPYYSFKCFSKLPILYILPQYITNKIFKNVTFHDYYFEPAGKDGDVFYQFNCKDYEKGMKMKKKFEILNTQLQSFFILLGLFIIISFIIYRPLGLLLLLIFILLYMTRFLNPVHTTISWMRVLISKYD
tara:strand:+ start:468 stop:1637 length:1170 start_codon:yes stop_codon:yes gene_type:complete